MSVLFNHWHEKQPFLTDKALPSISQAGYSQLMKILITLEPDGMFRSNYSLQFIITYYYYCSDTGMHNGDETSPSIILVSQGLLLKFLTTLEPQSILYTYTV